ncbi:MAG: hypothetical protein JSS61_05075 [Verrucomicrobia bacterium]|nr:hypothetical protein [Verrucomicrobiota bacterium]
MVTAVTEQTVVRNGVSLKCQYEPISKAQHTINVQNIQTKTSEIRKFEAVKWGTIGATVGTIALTVAAAVAVYFCVSNPIGWIVGLALVAGLAVAIGKHGAMATQEHLDDLNLELKDMRSKANPNAPSKITFSATDMNRLIRGIEGGVDEALHPKHWAP